MFTAALLAAVLGAAAAAAELDSDVLDPRLFIITNSSDTNMISYVAAGLGLVLVFGLLLVVALFALGFFGGAGGLQRYDYYQPDSYATYGQGQGPVYQQGFQARSLAGTAYDAISILTMLEDAFRKMEVADFVCQQRLVCEAHGAEATEKYGEVASRLQKIVGSADERATDGADSQVAGKFAAFRDAAMRGIQQQDCQLTYAAKCPKGLRHYVTASSKY